MCEETIVINNGELRINDKDDEKDLYNPNISIEFDPKKRTITVHCRYDEDCISNVKLYSDIFGSTFTIDVGGYEIR